MTFLSKNRWEKYYEAPKAKKKSWHEKNVLITLSTSVKLPIRLSLPLLLPSSLLKQTDKVKHFYERRRNFGFFTTA